MSETSACLEWSLADTAAAIAARRISASEVVQAVLAAIARWQPHLNAFVAVDAEGALAAAHEADRALARGAPVGPLHGVPLAHKDMFYRKGAGAGCGSVIRATWRAETTATVLARLDAAGAVTVGRLNMAEWAFGPTGHNVHVGDCANPWARDRITGGSSSGSGAAVAARLVYGALGSDTGGSVRLPAAFCGVVGVKPTLGRVPRHGAMPLSFSLDTIGPLCRTARDAALMLRVVAGADEQDGAASARPVPDYLSGLDRPLTGRRVAVLLQGDLCAGLAPAVGDAIEAAAGVLSAEGAVLSTAAPFEMAPLGALANLPMKPEAAAIHAPMLQARPADYSPQVRSRIEGGFAVPARRYLETASLRAHLLRRFVATMLDDVDAVLAPTALFPAPTRAATDVQRPADVPAMLGPVSQCTRPINYLGLPAVSVPCGFVDGLPVAFQLIGRPFDEGRLLHIAHRYQTATDWHQRAPAL